VLRIAFLSGFTLELAASLSVALVAVSIGLRLVAGDLTLLPGLFVLVLAPEVFVPLRNVGAAFHASAEGVAASSDAFDLEAAVSEGPAAGRVAGHDRDDPWRTGCEPHGGLCVHDLRVERGGALVLDGFRLDARPGEFVAVTGPSGSGKSSLFAAILGFVEADGGLHLQGRPLIRGDRSAIAWAGQAPVLLAGSVADNVRLGDEHADPAHLHRALRLAAVELDPERRLGPGGAGLSGGQAQRVATARAIHRLLARDGRLLLLDEPTSAQDAPRESALGAGLRELAADGRVVVVATHRSSLTDAADRTIELAGAYV
jgi:ATP-binding cassette subfamily C protein CydD